MSDIEGASPRVTIKKVAVPLSDGTARYLEEQLARFRTEILTRLQEISDANEPATSGGKKGELSYSPDQLARVLREIELFGPKEPPGKIATFFTLFPPFTCLCFGLCLLFGAFGLLAMNDAAGIKGIKSEAGGFLDIAKIFAGAIVGSATATALNARRRVR